MAITNETCENHRKDIWKDINKLKRSKIGWISISSVLGVSVLIGIVFWNGYTKAQDTAREERQTAINSITSINTEMLWIKKYQEDTANQLKSLNNKQEEILRLLKRLHNRNDP